MPGEGISVTSYPSRVYLQGCKLIKMTFSNLFDSQHPDGNGIKQKYNVRASISENSMFIPNKIWPSNLTLALKSTLYLDPKN